MYGNSKENLAVYQSVVTTYNIVIVLISRSCTEIDPVRFANLFYLFWGAR